jgi:hypothetical protein
MTRRLTALAAVVLLVAAACGGSSDPTADKGGVTVARPLAYSLTGDVALDYRVEMDMAMTTTFGDSFTALDPSMPGSMDMTMEFEMLTGYRISDGDEPGTYRVTMDVRDLELGGGSFKMGSETMDFSDLPQSQLDDVLDQQVMEVSYIITEQGEVLSMEVAGVPIDINGILGGTSAGSATGQMFGPQLPDGPVNVGDTWTTVSEEQLPGMDPIVTEQTHTITGREEKNGYDTWLIKTEASTGAYTITWDDLVAMAGELGGLAELGVDESMPPAFTLSMRSSPTGSTTYTWFAPDLGVTVAQDTTAHISMTMEMGGLPNTGGRAVGMSMDGSTHMYMELEQ